MKLPCMVIIFNKEMLDKLPVGISAHAVMWLGLGLMVTNIGSPNHGEFSRHGFDAGEIDDGVVQFTNWKYEDYRKLVMTSPETIESLFEKFKKAEVPVYMQKTSHPIKMMNTPFTQFPQPAYPEGTSICLAVFCWKDEHKKLLEGMELM